MTSEYEATDIIKSTNDNNLDGIEKQTINIESITNDEEDEIINIPANEDKTQSPVPEDEFFNHHNAVDNTNNIHVVRASASVEESGLEQLNLSDHLVRKGSFGTDGKPMTISEKTEVKSEEEHITIDTKNVSLTSSPQIIGEGMNEGKFSVKGLEILEEDVHMDENMDFKLSQEERNNLISEYQKCFEEVKIARELNVFLQARLSEYFRKKRTENLDPSAAIAGPADSIKDSDLDLKLEKLMGTLNELREQYKNTQISYKSSIDTLKITCAIKQKEVEESYATFVKHRVGVALSSVSARSGKNMTQKEIDVLLNQEAKKEVQVATVRMENLRLLHTMKKLEEEVKSKEQLAGGLHLIDFEQLKIENQTHNEKIEERYEELLKLKRKISTTVQILTHFKEKNESTIREKNRKIEQLHKAEEDLKMKRDKLARTKHLRDKLKSENEKLDTAGGLLIKPKLLVDFEETLNYTEVLKDKQRTVQNLAASYRSQIDRLQNKMEQIEF